MASVPGLQPNHYHDMLTDLRRNITFGARIEEEGKLKKK
jgi:copper(I)-binding protein